MKQSKGILLLAMLSLSASLGCSDDISQNPGCSVADIKCENNTQFFCVPSGWKATLQCPEGCDPDGRLCVVPDGMECLTDTCDTTTEGVLKKCVNNKYEITQCPEETPVCLGVMCIEGEKPDPIRCTGTAVRCSEDGKGTQTCKDGTWDEAVPCGEGKICDPNQKTCTEETALGCTGTETRCSPDNLGTQTCKDGNWGEIVPCDNGQTCNPDQKACAPQSGEPCSGETAECLDAAQYRVCKNGTWSQTEACTNAICQIVSNEVQCVPVPLDWCKKGDKRCGEDGKYAQICQDNGEWGEHIDCEIGKICDITGTCVNEEDAKFCNPEDKKCTDAPVGIASCDNTGHWKQTITCDGNKVCDANFECKEPSEAVICKDGEKTCTSINAISTCKDNAWTEITSCPLDKPHCIDGNCVKMNVTCAEGETVCGASNNQQVLKCENATWTVTQTCKEDMVCDPTSGECVKTGTQSESCSEENKTTCSSTPDSIRTCINGVWVTESCGTGKFCDPVKSECVTLAASECIPGTEKCTDNGEYQICGNDKQFKTLADCGTKNQCRTLETTVKGELPGCNCKNTYDQKNDPDTRCASEGVLLTCVRENSLVIPTLRYNTWVETKCEDRCIQSHEVTPNSDYCGCTPTSKQCNKDDIQECKEDGTWDKAKSCGLDSICDPTTNQCVPKDGLCEKGHFKCDEKGDFYHCNNDGWEKLASCGSPSQCTTQNDANTKLPIGCTCVKDEMRCDTEKNNILKCEEDSVGLLSSKISYMRLTPVESCILGYCKDDPAEKNNPPSAHCACEMGTARCDKEQLRYCYEDQWSDMLVECKQFGKPNIMCHPGFVSCIDKQCISTATRCAENTLLTCQNGIYVPTEQCAVACWHERSDLAQILGKCIPKDEEECTSGQVRCNIDFTNVQVCEKGHWKKDAQCAAGQKCVERTIGLSVKGICENIVCTETETRCAENSKTQAGAIEFCQNNKWTTIAQCPIQTECKRGKCVPKPLK